MAQLLNTLKRKLALTDADKLESLRTQLGEIEAQQDAAQAALGAALVDDLPTAEASAQLEAAEKRARELTAAITTVERRIQAATDRAKADAMAAKREVLRSALAVVQSDARALEHDFETLQQHTKALADSVTAALTAAAGAGDDSKHSRLTSGRNKFKFYLLYASSIMPACGVPYVKDLERYSDNFPKPSDV